MNLTNNSIYMLRRIYYHIPCEYRITSEEVVEATESLLKCNLIYSLGIGKGWKVPLKGRWIAFRFNK